MNKRSIFKIIGIVAIVVAAGFTLQSAMPVPDHSYATCYWYDDIDVDAEITISGWLWGGGYGSESFTAVKSSGNSRTYALENAYLNGKVYREYTFDHPLYGSTTVDDWYYFSKTTLEMFDQVIPVVISSPYLEEPIEE